MWRTFFPIKFVLMSNLCQNDAEEQSKMLCFNIKPVNNDNNGYLRLVKIDGGHHDIGDFV